MHDAAVALRKFLQQDPLFVDRRKVVGSRPVLGDVLGAPIEMVGFERLEPHRRVAEIFEPHLVEIVASDIDVEIFGPIVLHPLVHDGAASDELLDAVGAVAERRFERGRADIALPPRSVGALPPMLRQHVELTHDLRQFPIARCVEDESDLALAGLLDFGDVPVIGRKRRIVGLECLHGEDDVVDGHRLAVVMARGRAQAERRRAKVAWVAHCLGDEAVLGGHFIERRHEQCVRDHTGSRGDRAFEAGDDLVEVVEGADRHQPHASALGRVRVDVIEMLEGSRIFEVAEQRQAMPPFETALSVSRLGARRGAEERQAVEDRT